MLAQDGLWIGSVHSNSIMIEYIEQCRQRLATVAVFQCGYTSKPVAWAMRFPFTGGNGSLFTTIPKALHKNVLVTSTFLPMYIFVPQVSRNDSPLSQ